MQPDSTQAAAVARLSIEEAMALVTLLGFAIQRVLEMLDPFLLAPATASLVSWRAGRRRGAEAAAVDLAVAAEHEAAVASAKRAVAAAAAFSIGLVITSASDLRLLAYVGTDRAGLGVFTDAVITALVLSAGTEGVNTIVKYFGYVKDARREQAVAAAATAGALSAAGAALTVMPAKVTLAPRQRVQFTAASAGGAPVPAEWTVLPGQSGTIGADGTYTAPDAAGTYRVIAASQADRAAFGIAEVSVA